MLNPSGIVPRHLILHLQNQDGESQHAGIAQPLFGQALREGMHRSIRWCIDNGQEI
jgi:hypothetical protein